MDLGEVVKITQPDFGLTTPSPQVISAIRQNCGRIHPSLKKEGKHSFSIFLFLFSNSFTLGLNFSKSWTHLFRFASNGEAGNPSRLYRLAPSGLSAQAYLI
jgi:hypothetical protein